MEKMDAKLQELKDEIKEMKDHVKNLETGKKISKEAGEKLPSSAESAAKKLESTALLRSLIYWLSLCTHLVFFLALKERLRKMEIKRTEKDDLKEVSTSTAKINYIDPRVSIAWCDKVEVPLAKVFSKTVRDKFNWAIAEVAENADYEF